MRNINSSICFPNRSSRNKRIFVPLTKGFFSMWISKLYIGTAHKESSSTDIRILTTKINGKCFGEFISHYLISYLVISARLSEYIGIFVRDRLWKISLERSIVRIRSHERQLTHKREIFRRDICAKRVSLWSTMLRRRWRTLLKLP